MSHHQPTSETVGASLRVFTLLLLSLFATELAVMGLISELLPRFHPLLSGLLDATLLSLFLAWPLWFFATRALTGLQDDGDTVATSAVRRLWLQALTVVFVTEFLVMQLQPLWPAAGGARLRDLFDSVLATALSGPFLWRLFFRPEMRRCRASMTDLLGTPFGLYVLLLYMVLVADLLLDNLLPVLFPDPQLPSHRLADSIATTLLLAPFLWFFVARPLQRAIVTEHARVRAVRTQLNDAIVSLDAQGTIESFNQAAERIFGYSEAAVVGQRADLLLATGRSDLATLLQRAASRDGQRGLPPIYQLEGRRSDGSAATMEVSLSRVIQAGREEYLLVMRDISERRAMEKQLCESEARFRQIFEQSEDAILFFEPGTLRLLDANRTAETFFGIDRQALRAEGAARFFDCADFRRLDVAVRTVRAGEVFQLEELACRRSDGEERFVMVRGKIMPLPGTELVYCTLRDITDRIRLEKEARSIQAKLIQANKMTSLGLMVSGVAHEINNPNNYILANTQLLARAWADAAPILHEYQREHGDFCLGGFLFSELDQHSSRLFAGIEDGARRINEIVSELKNFVRERPEPTLLPVDVNQVVRSALSILHHELVRHTENFHLELASELPAVAGRSQHLGQVIVNLLMNACQALPDRSGHVWLATDYDAAAKRVRITVRDDGRGIPAEAGNKILEPFFTTKLDSGGTGLGLAISLAIVKEHGGALDFRSLPGEGTIFIVSLPVWQHN